MLITFSLHLCEKCTKNIFLICQVNFQICSNKRSHYDFKVYPYRNIFIPLANWTIYASILKLKKNFFSNLMPKVGLVFLPSTSLFKVGRAITLSSFAHEVTLLQFELQTHTGHLNIHVVPDFLLCLCWSIFIHNLFVSHMSFCYENVCVFKLFGNICIAVGYPIIKRRGLELTLLQFRDCTKPDASFAMSSLCHGLLPKPFNLVHLQRVQDIQNFNLRQLIVQTRKCDELSMTDSAISN